MNILMFALNLTLNVFLKHTFEWVEIHNWFVKHAYCVRVICLNAIFVIIFNSTTSYGNDHMSFVLMFWSKFSHKSIYLVIYWNVIGQWFKWISTSCIFLHLYLSIYIFPKLYFCLIKFLCIKNSLSFGFLCWTLSTIIK